MSTETQPVHCLLPANNYLGESPVWCPQSQTLFWINCEAEPTLFRMDPASGEVQQWPMPERIGTVILREQGGIIVALASGLYNFDPQTQALDLIAANPQPDTIVLHEGKCDRQGRLWIGSLSKRMQSHGELGGASFFRLEGDQLISEISGLSVSNGLAWSPDGTVMYHTDTPAATVWAYDYNINTGVPTNRRVLFTHSGPGGLDGAAVDADGGYWVALFQGGCVQRYTPSGQLDREITLPMSQPTMPAFGGKDYKTMFITSTQYRKSVQEKQQEPLLGAVFTIDSVAQGLPEPRFHR